MSFKTKKEREAQKVHEAARHAWYVRLLGQGKNVVSQVDYDKAYNVMLNLLLAWRQFGPFDDHSNDLRGRIGGLYNEAKAYYETLVSYHSFTMDQAPPPLADNVILFTPAPVEKQG